MCSANCWFVAVSCICDSRHTPFGDGPNYYYLPLSSVISESGPKVLSQTFYFSYSKCMRCKCGRSAYHRKTKHYQWRCSNGHEFGPAYTPTTSYSTSIAPPSATKRCDFWKSNDVNDKVFQHRNGKDIRHWYHRTDLHFVSDCGYLVEERGSSSPPKEEPSKKDLSLREEFKSGVKEDWGELKKDLGDTWGELKKDLGDLF